jgi:hypothetical protein
MDRPLKYRDLLKKLKRFGVVEDKKRGKGSERMLVGMVNGTVQRYPTKCHNENDDKPRAVIQAIRRRFKLTKEDGVSDGEFYS